MAFPQTRSKFYLKLNLQVERLRKLAYKPKPRVVAGVGFTGSRKGSDNKLQRDVLKKLLNNLCLRNSCYEEMLVEHGDCEGWDAVCHEIAQKLHLRVYLHPPTNSSFRANCPKPTLIFPEKPYLDRNKVIVDRTRCLVAVSSTMKEEQRSGTWSTVRYARKQGKPVFIILPNGALQSEI